MSAVADIFILDRSKLEGVRSADDLARESKERLSYDSSGYVLAAVVAYLSTQGIQLQSPDHNEAASLLTQALGASVVVFAADRRRHVDALDPSSFDRADLRRYYDELMGPAENGAADAMIDGIKLLHDALQRLGDDDVAALVIG